MLSSSILKYSDVISQFVRKNSTLYKVENITNDEINE